MAEDAILLESGTNEVEILEFKVGENSLGINVIKVREVINLVPVTRTPHAHRSIEGLIILREETIPLIDLTSYLDYPDAMATDEDKIIIAELNKLKAAFRSTLLSASTGSHGSKFINPRIFFKQMVV